MKPYARTRFFFPGSEYPIQTYGPAGWYAGQIIYKKISYRMTTDGLEFFLHPASGIVQADTSIGTFIASLFATHHSELITPTSFPAPLDFTIAGLPDGSDYTPTPGYLVFELDRKGNVQFNSNIDAISTNDPASQSNNAPESQEYFGLVHVASPQLTYAGSGLPVGTSIPNPHPGCNIAYLQFMSPSKNGSLNPAQQDLFNLYATINQVSFNPAPPSQPVVKQLNITIDPGVTNTGGPPPSQMVWL